MPDSDRLDKVFARCMVNQPFGHALYKPVSGTVLKPGICGYFDVDGDWKKIADLTDNAALAAAGYTTIDPDDLEPLTEPETGWGVRHSSDTTQFYPQIGLSAELPGAPAGGGITLGYRTSAEVGAVLIPEGTITHNQLGPTSRLCNWLMDNANKVLQNKPDAKKKGIWIVTKTYTAQRRALTLISSKENEVTIELSASAFSIGELTLSNSWLRGHKDSGWGVQSDPKGVVLFLSGVQWRPRWYRQTTKPKAKRHEQQWLGSKDNEVKLGNLEVKVDADGHPKRELRELVPKIVGTLARVQATDDALGTAALEGSRTFDFFNDVDEDSSDSDDSSD